MIRAASYCRVSTDHGDQVNSFESQVRYFREYIERQSGWVLADIYADEGVTGTATCKRPQFLRMMEDARAGKFDLIVTKEVSRFSRNILDAIACTRQLRELGVYVCFVNDGFSTRDPDSELRLSIMGAMAQEESRRTSARVTWGQTRQMERGVVFGRSMLGYEVKNGTLTVEPEGAELVRLIFHKYAVEKMGTTRLCRWLEEQGYRTFSGNPHWNGSHLVKLLRNEKYVGDLIQKKTYTPDYLSHRKKTNPGEKIVIKGHHEPILDREVWDLAQAELRSRRKQGMARSSKLPFSGLIRCGVCGRTFVSRMKQRPDGSSYRRWACPGQCGVGRLVRDDDAGNMVRLALDALKLDGGAIADRAARLAAGGRSEDPARPERELMALQEKRAKALDRYLEGKLTEEELELLRSRYDRQIGELKRRISGPAASEQPDETAIRERVLTLLDIGGEDLYRTILREIVVCGDRHMELRLQGLEQVFYFE